MTPIESYFDAIFLVNLKRRVDRLEESKDVFAQLGMDFANVRIFEAHDKPHADVPSGENPLVAGRPDGNFGCTSSHRGLFEIIAHEKIPRALILEDDFDIAFTGPDRRRKCDPQALFAAYVPELPTRWDMLFLGRHFAEMPQAFRSPHVVKIGRMLTTSSYGITAEFARKIAPHVSGIGPIDTLLGGFQRDNECYCVEPTLFIQRKSFSDLRDQVEDYVSPMQDMNHLNALRAGTVYPPPPKPKPSGEPLASPFRAS